MGDYRDVWTCEEHHYNPHDVSCPYCTIVTIKAKYERLEKLARAVVDEWKALNSSNLDGVDYAIDMLHQALRDDGGKP